jgi:hypothetical protein
MRGFTSKAKVFTVPSQVIAGPVVFELLLLQDMMKDNKANADKNKNIFFINDGF